MGWQRVCCVISYIAATKRLEDNPGLYANAVLVRADAVIWWHMEGRCEEHTEMDPVQEDSVKEE